MNTLTKLQACMTGWKALLPTALALSAVSALAGMAPCVIIWLIIRECSFAGADLSGRLITQYAWLAVATAIVSMPLGFFNNNTTGQTRKIIDDNAGITHGFLAHQLPDLAGTILAPLALLVMIFVFDWRLAITCLVPVVFSIFIMGFMNSIVRYKEMVTEYTKMWEKPMSVYTVFINGFVFFLVPTALLIIISTGDYTYTILNLFLYVFITPIFSQSIMRSMYLNQASGQAFEAVNRIENLTAYPQLKEAALPQRLKAYNVEFRNVTFTYPGTNKKVIDNVSFTVQEGKTVALVGASGGGKTTIARLVPRFWDADEKQIIVGGSDIKDIDSEQLMNHVSFLATS